MMGGWRAIFITNTPISGLEKFQSIVDPPIYKSSGSVENSNSFNLGG